MSRGRVYAGCTDHPDPSAALELKYLVSNTASMNAAASALSSYLVESHFIEIQTPLFPLLYPVLWLTSYMYDILMCVYIYIFMQT